MFWKPNRTDERIILHLTAYNVYTTPNMLPLRKLELTDVAICPFPWEVCKIYRVVFLRILLKQNTALLSYVS